MGNKHVFIKTIPCPNNKNIENTRYQFILVEGKNDKTIYQSVYDKDNWIIKVIGEEQEDYHDRKHDRKGKQDIIDLIRDYNTSNNHQEEKVGIVDRDYDPKERLDNLFYTDKNDIESTAIQILSDDEAYEILPKRVRISCDKRLFQKIYSNAKTIAQELSNLWKNIRDERFNTNTNISYLINLYDKNEQALLNGIIDKAGSIYVINYKKLLNLYKEKTTNDYIKDMDVNKLKNIMQQPLNHFRGHDFFHILKYLIIKETNINASEIYDFEKDCMIESVKKEWIKRTNLYQDVKDTGAFK